MQGLWQSKCRSKNMSARTPIADKFMRLSILFLPLLFAVACGGGGGSGGDGEEPVVTGLDERPNNRSCMAAETSSTGTISLEAAFPDLPDQNALLGLHQAPSDDSEWFAVSQTGSVVKFTNSPTVSSVSPFINIADRIGNSGGERGLLGLAFHPQYPTQPQVFLSYTNTTGNAIESRLSRFSLNTAGTALNPDSEQILLRVSQPFANHNGGNIAFGPDGFLYFGIGDGGSGGDPQGNGQNQNSLLGTMLRIDVLSPPTGQNYGIPNDNPFAAGGSSPGDGAEEIFAYGLRNPFRWSFDSLNGDLWVGDVGQNEIEEIDVVENGDNLGWNVMEGRSCFNAESCDQTGLKLPVAEYTHAGGNCSVTGGYVYRGDNLPAMQGQYLFGDFCTGNIWSIAGRDDDGLADNLLLDTSLNISSFAEGLDGEVYVLDRSGGAGEEIFRFVSSQPASSGSVPQKLSETGCLQASDPRQPADGVIPYEVIAELWSDGADKQRFFALPDGSNININDDGDMQFPLGSVLVKHFILDGNYIETRFFHNQTAGWRGYSYEWNEEQTDGFLLAGSKDTNINGQPYHYPSRGECDACHTQAANISLGPETRQLNSDFTYPQTGRTANQLTTLEQNGFFSGSLSEPQRTERFVAIDDSNGSVNDRARSYLHSNCSNCHRPGGTGRSDMDLRAGIEFADMNICNAEPQFGDLGNSEARVLKPGEPMNSVLRSRMALRGENQMPPLATQLVDSTALAVIDAWIAEISDCPAN